MHNPHSPHAFLRSDGYGSSSQAAVPGPVVREPVAPYAAVVLPRSVPAPTLTVRPNGDVTLTKALLAALPHVKDCAPIDLVPPVRRGRGGTWHLDTRATAPRRLPDPSKVARFGIPAPAQHHFQRVASSEYVSELIFTLGPPVPGFPGYYALVRHNESLHELRARQYEEERAERKRVEREARFQREATQKAAAHERNEQQRKQAESWRQRRAAIAAWYLIEAPTHCPFGHVYDENNPYYAPERNKRICGACQQLSRVAHR